MTCRRGEFCAARHQHGGKPAPADRPLCHRDEDELSRALREFPELLVQLRVAARAALPGRGLTEPTAGGNVVPPLLFRADLDELAELLVRTTWEWAMAVAVQARIPVPPPGEHYAGRSLLQCVAVLRPRLSVLLALRDIAVYRDGEIVELDGGDAALELFSLHHRVRAVLGVTRKVVYLTEPCPREDCGVKALCRYDGHDGVRCASCGAEFELDDIQGARVHQPGSNTTVIALGDNQFTRETTSRVDGGTVTVREQYTGHPDGEAAVLVGRTETMRYDIYERP